MPTLVIVDSRIGDPDSLLTGLPTNAEVLRLDTSRNGVLQIAEYLDGQTGYDALHVLSHGGSGTLLLGDATVDRDSVETESALWRRVGASLNQDADILLYGCDVAAGEAGQEFIGALARLTEADVAASTGLTGATARGGDWVLETAAGPIEATPFAPTQTLSDYAGVLSTPLPLGGTVTGDMANGSRTFAISAPSAGILVLTFDVPNSYSNGANYAISLWGSEGTMAEYNDQNAGDPIVFSIGVPQAGTYYVGISNYYAAVRYGLYSLSASHIASADYGGYETENNDSHATADTLALGGMSAGQLDSTNDIDYFAIEVDSSGTLTLFFDAPNGAGTNAYTINLENSDGSVLATLANAGDPQSLGVDLEQAGTYYARVSSTNSFYVDHRIYTLSASLDGGVPLHYETEQNYNHTVANPLALGETITGQLADSNDTDYFAIAVNESGMLNLRLDRLTPVYGAISISLEDPSGVTLASYSDTTISRTYTFSVAQPGTYFARIKADGAGFSLYDLTVSQGTGDIGAYESEANDSRASADTLALDGTITGQLSAATDVDCYAITVADAGTLTLLFDRPDITGSAFSISLEDANGTILASFGDRTDPRSVSIGIAQAGIYYAQVTAGHIYDSGQYTLGVSYVAGGEEGYETEWNGTRGTADSLAPGNTILGQLSSIYDSDYFAIPVEQAGVLNLTFSSLDALGGGTATATTSYGGNFYINLEDANGTVLASYTNSTNDQSYLVGVSQAGIYYARVLTNPFYNTHFDGRYRLGSDFTAGGATGFETESNNTHATADTLLLDSTISGQLGSTSDVDYFAVALDSAGVLTLGFNRSKDYGYRDYSIRLEDADGNLLTAFTEYASLTRHDVYVAQAGIYYARISPNSGYFLKQEDELYGLSTHLATGSPSITSNGGEAYASISLEENTTVVSTVTAPSGASLTYSLAGGADALRFGINTSTGALYFLTPPDFEKPTDVDANNTYEVIVQAGYSTINATQAISITVTDTLEADHYHFDSDLSNHFQSWSEAPATGLAEQIGGVLRFHTQGQLADAGGIRDGYLSTSATPRFDQSWSIEVYGTVPASLGDGAHAYGAYLEAGLTVMYTEADGTHYSLSSWLGLGEAGARRYNSEYAISSSTAASTEYLNDQGERATTDASGLLGIRFDAVSKVLTAYNSQQVLLNIDLDATGITHWNMSDSDTFQLGLGFSAAGWVIPDTLAMLLDDFAYAQTDDTRTWGSAGNDSLTGRATLQNRLLGLDGDDTLVGGSQDDQLIGGLGRDILSGGLGNDTYLVDNRGDTIVESNAQGSGIDSVRATLSWALGANLENLELLGSKQFSGTGNSLDNTLTGNVAANVLNGGTGADTLIGGAGNDTYIVDNAGDTIQETGADANDSVRSWVDWTLGDNLENLVLLGTHSLNGSGNALNNTLTGNGRNNMLNGEGGNDFLDGASGNDTLSGGIGADTFAFTTPLNALRNVDTITDFVSDSDKIQLSSAIFREMGFSGSPGSDAFFHLGDTPQDADDRVLYDQAVGSLYYDSDGAGALAAVQFATLLGSPSLTYIDIYVG